MKLILPMLSLAAALAASGAGAELGADRGRLTCKLISEKNLVVYTTEEFDCEFTPKQGDAQKYKGKITAIGANLSVTKDMTLVWEVLAPTFDSSKSDALIGKYVGGSASVALAAGGGDNMLVGANKNSVTLQPISVSGIKGTGVRLGIDSFELK